MISQMFLAVVMQTCGSTLMRRTMIVPKGCYYSKGWRYWHNAVDEVALVCAQLALVKDYCRIGRYRHLLTATWA